MNLLKSIFISGFITLMSALLAIAVYQMVVSTDQLSWLGLAVGSAATVGFFGYLFTAGAARTSAGLNIITALAVLGLIISAAGYFVYQESYVPALLGLFLVVSGWLKYVYWYSRFGKRDDSSIQVGKSLPAFELADVEGQSISSQRFSEQPSLLMFYRGNWCPLCMAQIKEVAAKYNELKAMGVHVALISPQPHDKTEALAKQFDAAMNFYVDKDNAAAKVLKIDSEFGTPAGMQALGYENDTVLPTVIATDAAGQIIFADLTDNYRVRPEPETFIEVFKQAL